MTHGFKVYGDAIKFVWTQTWFSCQFHFDLIKRTPSKIKTQ